MLTFEAVRLEAMKLEAGKRQVDAAEASEFLKAVFRVLADYMHQHGETGEDEVLDLILEAGTV